jgi:palmitoyltransferase ZDHHC2/15/20
MSRFQALKNTPLFSLRKMRTEYGPSLVFLFLFSPWIHSCIGFHNRKPFILMLVYTNLVTLIGMIGFACSLPAYIKVFQTGEGSIIGAIILGIALVLNIIIFGAIFSFLRFHLRLIFNNQTTIETLELTRQGRNPDEAESAYDIGRIDVK